MRICKGATAFAVALLAALALAGGTATADWLHPSSTTFRIVWSPLISRIGLNTIECTVTLEGSFHTRTIFKVAGALIGAITSARATRPCASPPRELWILNGTEGLGGGMTAPNTLPWHVRYVSYSGTLPAIERVKIDIVGASLLYEFTSLRCLYRSTAAAPFAGSFELNGDGTILGFRADESTSIPSTSPFPCNMTALRLQGIGGVSVAGGPTAIDVALI